jgi:hypothetical protein
MQSVGLKAKVETGIIYWHHQSDWVHKVMSIQIPMYTRPWPFLTTSEFTTTIERFSEQIMLDIYFNRGAFLTLAPSFVSPFSYVVWWCNFRNLALKGEKGETSQIGLALNWSHLKSALSFPFSFAVKIHLEQCGQIGRIFSYGAVVYFVQFFLQITQEEQILVLLFSMVHI